MDPKPQDIVNYLLSLKPERAVAIFLNISCIICPGMLFMFLFDSLNFLRIDTLKLIFICICLGIPFSLFIYLVSGGIRRRLIELITVLLEIKALDRFGMTFEKQDLIIEGFKKDFDKVYISGYVGALSWVLTGLIALVVYLFNGPKDVIYYAYFIVLIFLIMVVGGGTLIKFILRNLTEIIDKKNEIDHDQQKRPIN